MCGRLRLVDTNDMCVCTNVFCDDVNRSYSSTPLLFRLFWSSVNDVIVDCNAKREGGETTMQQEKEAIGLAVCSAVAATCMSGAVLFWPGEMEENGYFHTTRVGLRE